MTDSRIEVVRLTQRHLDSWAPLDPRFRDWPVVYTLNDERSVYVGESLSAATRLSQHLRSPVRGALTTARVIVDPRFNKSVCLDLESHLIRLFAGDGKYTVLNRNDGITHADYFERASYRESFRTIFDDLRAAGLFDRSVSEIENSDLFKLSPFKALTPEQAGAVEEIVESLLQDVENGVSSRSVVQGEPGTGKTIVAIYLMKLLRDIQLSEPEDAPDHDSVFSDFFQRGNAELLDGFKVGLVVPQQSLRTSIQRVFRKTPGLRPGDVLSPYQVGASSEQFDLLIVDEAHRLSQRAAQASGPLNAKYVEINKRLFGEDDLELTQLDWIERLSKHQLLLVDRQQSIKPGDLPDETLANLVSTAREEGRWHPLVTQMRVRAGTDYVGYVRSVLSDVPPEPMEFEDYDLRLYDDLAEMRDAIRSADESHGLARLVAGYAWRWRSKRDPAAYDIEIGDVRLRWNSTVVDWVASPSSLDEVGSIHTIQGYDLNYAGVIIGNDLQLDPATGRLRFSREDYFDVSGKKNNPQRGITYSDDEILQYVRNIYAVLLTRGMLGTFVYVCDPGLRELLRPYFTAAKSA